MRPVKMPQAIISVSIADNIVVNINVLQSIRMETTARYASYSLRRANRNRPSNGVACLLYHSEVYGSISTI